MFYLSILQEGVEPRKCSARAVATSLPVGVWGPQAAEKYALWGVRDCIPRAPNVAIALSAALTSDQQDSLSQETISLTRTKPDPL